MSCLGPTGPSPGTPRYVRLLASHHSSVRRAWPCLLRNCPPCQAAAGAGDPVGAHAGQHSRVSPAGARPTTPGEGGGQAEGSRQQTPTRVRCGAEAALRLGWEGGAGSGPARVTGVGYSPVMAERGDPAEARL